MSKKPRRRKPAESPQPKVETAPVQQLRYRIPQAAKILGLSRSMTWYRVQRGELKSVRDGTRVLITHAECERYAPLDHASLKSKSAGGNGAP